MHFLHKTRTEHLHVSSIRCDYFVASVDRRNTTNIVHGIKTDLKKLEPILILTISTASTIMNTTAINATTNLSATSTSAITSSGNRGSPSCS